ncbi:zinc finger, CCHC-type [Artemisia annua]|uniref:Zinc finger, CCHC-type n=1 Tax=Artemisia annua TaxID=35608 RepID=A0A2U1KIN6_ARTAN|nr:zinc finger, CCHC-type [Artemisia annua]
MKDYLDQLERLGFPMPPFLGVNLILTSLSKDYDTFETNYNMHSMGKIIPVLHAMLKLDEKGLIANALAVALAVMAIRQGKIQANNKSQAAKGREMARIS